MSNQASSDSPATESSTKNSQDPPHNDNGSSEDEAKEEQQHKPSWIKRQWTSLGIDWPTFRTMLKWATSPTIGLAIYQAKPVADHFTTIGYLIAISSMLSFPIMPRAKFLENMILNVFAVCLGAAVSILALWSAVQARLHTSSGPYDPYSSSAAAVCGIWMVFEVWLINTFRSARPQNVFPAIMTSIFAVVSLSYGHTFPDLPTCIDFARRLLEGFLTGFAIATAVNLLVFPVSSRSIVLKELTGSLTGLQKLINAQRAYRHHLENVNMFRDKSPKAAALNAAVGGLTVTQGKLIQDLPYGKREMAYGKMEAHDLSELYRQIRLILLPLIGLGNITDFLTRFANMSGWTTGEGPETEEELVAVRDWQVMLRAIHGAFEDINSATIDALEHIMIMLELKKKSKQLPDEEINATAPGQPGFRNHYEGKMQEYYRRRELSLRDWCNEKGIKVPMQAFNGVLPGKTHHFTDSQKSQRQLLALLYMEWLVWDACTATLKLVDVAEEIGSRKTHLIVPGWKRFRKSLRGLFHHKYMASEEHFENTGETADHEFILGAAFKAKKDPEHLPAVTVWQKFGNVIRGFPRFMRSPHSIFGFRVACAVMSVNIVSYLKVSTLFFVHQRLFWSSIMVCISMNRLAGTSLFNFILRIFGTIVAVVASYVIWYIVDGHAAGVLVFEFIWMTCASYIIVKKHRFIPIGMISTITTVLVIGYELQVQKIGVILSTSNYQAYYPLYELAPYRLAAVTGGLFVAWIWTIFPYPISEHSEIRKDFGAALYMLAHHYAIVHDTVIARVRGEDEGDPLEKTSPGRRLMKARMDSFARLTIMISRMKVNSSFQPWSLTLGGKFPKELYDKCIDVVENILTYSALIAYSSKTFTIEHENMRAWKADMLKLQQSIEPTSANITTRLSVLSHSVTDGRALPPHLPFLEPYLLLDRLEVIDRDILSINHLTEPGYAAFAVMQIASRSVVDDVNKLTDAVRELVGELDFAFYHNSATSSVAGSEEKLDRNLTKGSKKSHKSS